MIFSIHDKPREHKTDVSKKFMVVLNYYFEDYFEYNPEFASTLGIKYHDKLLKDYSDKAYEKEIDLNKNTQRKLKLINPYNLTEEEHVDYLLLKILIEKTLFEHENLPQKRHTLPQLYFPTEGIYALFMKTLTERERLEALLGRLSSIPRLVNQAKENLQNPPRLWTDTAIEQMPGIIQFISHIPEMDCVKNPPEKLKEMAGHVVKANEEAVAALEDLHRYFQVELVEKSHGEFCIGRQALDFLLAHEHFIEYTSGYLNELGYDLMAKAESDMKALAARIDKTKTFETIIAEMETEIPEKENLLAAYQDQVEKTRQFVIENDIMTLPDGEELTVIDTPKYFRSIIPLAAYYALGPYEELRKGEFWVTPIEEDDPEKARQQLMRGHNLNLIPSISLHEGYPGHHAQLMTAKKAILEDRASAVRSIYHNTMFIEGWALYCEQLMGELGYYTEKEEMMMLKNRYWRAARVVIDVELHTGRMSYDEAVAFLVNKVGMPEKFAKNEVTRYTMSPTQPLSYEIGRRLINQLRDKQKSKLGSSFNLKEFHDTLLSKASLPVKVIEELAFSQSVEVAK